MRFSIFHALGAHGALADYGAHMKNVRGYEQAAEDYRFTTRPTLAGTK